MSASLANPFRPTRWEHQGDGHQLIWFTKTADELAAEKSVYVRGSRGSGKTTLLKSICWEDLANNESLRLQRKVADFAHVGVYIRFPDHLSSSISPSRWSDLYPNSPDPEQEFHKFFSLVIEATCAERALVACHELRILRQLIVTSGLELSIVQQITSEFESVQTFTNVAPKTFLDLARCLRTMVRTMNQASGRGTLAELSSRLPAREPGEFIRYIATHLSNSIQISSASPKRANSPRFKFCLDDCEVLSHQQQKSLNTLVRVAKQPVSYVVSYVGTLAEVSETFIVQQPLTDADRKIISLDSRKDSDFRELCQAVVSLRLYFAASEVMRDKGAPSRISDFFPLEIRLGRKSVNDLMAAVAQRSASPVAQRLVLAASHFRELLLKRNRRYRLRYNHNADFLPLYETYVLLLWRGKEDSFRTDLEDADESRLLAFAGELNRPAFEAWLRRKQRAALLHFASTLGFRRVPLAGANIIVSLADGAIRDFLEILGEVFEAYARRHKLDPTNSSSLDRFVGSGSQLAADIQSEGIYAASTSYLEGVSARGEREMDILVRLLDGLGHYTAILQSDPSDPTVLGRAERGIFVLRFDGDASPDEKQLDNILWGAITRAEISGYLRTIDTFSSDRSEGTSGRRVVTFRLHRRFSPHFRFSYRGAYEGVSLNSRDLWPLCEPKSSLSPRAWALSVSKKVNPSDSAQLALPLLEVEQDE